MLLIHSHGSNESIVITQALAVGRIFLHVLGDQIQQGQSGGGKGVIGIQVGRLGKIKRDKDTGCGTLLLMGKDFQQTFITVGESEFIKYPEL